MEANGMMEGGTQEMAGRVPGTDLELVHNLQGEDLVLRVNKGGVLVFRAMLRDAAKEMAEQKLASFNSVAPDFVFTIGDREEGLRRMLGAAGVLEGEPPRTGFLRWLLGR